MFNKGVILIVLSSLFFASYGIWIRLIDGGFDIFFQGWTRGLLITIGILPFLFYKKLIVPIQKQDRFWFGLYLLASAFTTAPLFYAVTNMDIGAATLLFFVSMLLTMYLMGAFLYKEKINSAKMVSLVLAIVGMGLVFSFSLEKFTLLAILAAMLNGIASGSEISLSKKLTGEYSAWYITWSSWVVIFITSGLLSFIFQEKMVMPSFSLIWLWHILFTVSSLLAFYMVVEGFKYVKPAVGGLLGLLEIVFSILFGVFIFNESISSKLVLGCTLIIFAAALPHAQDLLLKEKVNSI
jgi:drug/metabolite transporter (DMT)-like permease